MVIGLSEVQFGLDPYFVIMSMITDRIELPEVLLPINHKNYNLQGKMINQVMKKKWKICIETEKVVCVSMVTETEDVIG